MFLIRKMPDGGRRIYATRDLNGSFISSTLWVFDKRLYVLVQKQKAYLSIKFFHRI